jgi:hypothetical protein
LTLVFPTSANSLPRFWSLIALDGVHLDGLFLLSIQLA